MANLCFFVLLFLLVVASCVLLLVNAWLDLVPDCIFHLPFILAQLCLQMCDCMKLVRATNI